MEAPEPKSSNKLAKLARKQARKMYNRDVQEQARDMGKMIGNAVKPKPWWVPMWVWMRGMSIFIKVRF